MRDSVGGFRCGLGNDGLGNWGSSGSPGVTVDEASETGEDASMISTSTVAHNFFRRALHRHLHRRCRRTGLDIPVRGFEPRGHARPPLRLAPLLEVRLKLWDLAILAAGNFSAQLFD